VKKKALYGHVNILGDPKNFLGYICRECHAPLIQEKVADEMMRSYSLSHAIISMRCRYCGKTNRIKLRTKNVRYV
jgi:RNase P subunit RPR2